MAATVSWMLIVKKNLFDLLTLIAALIGAGIWWRRASRRRQLPCPSWLAWLLNNPLTEAVGFEPTRYWGTPLAFTQNFIKWGD